MPQEPLAALSRFPMGKRSAAPGLSSSTTPCPPTVSTGSESPRVRWQKSGREASRCTFTSNSANHLAGGVMRNGKSHSRHLVSMLACVSLGLVGCSKHAVDTGGQAAKGEEGRPPGATLAVAGQYFDG